MNSLNPSVLVLPGDLRPMQRFDRSLDAASLVRVSGGDGFGGEGPMGKVTWKEDARLTLSLVGNFRLLDPDGRELRLSEKKGRVLLAMLATARDRRRSREWLKSRLWGRSFEPQASNSLRQCLHALRKALSPWEDVLQANYEHVWLEGIDIQIDPDSDTRTEFFEDAPALDDEGEDWLREERQAFHARVVDTGRAMVDVGQASRVVPVEPNVRPCILIGSPVVISDDARAAAVAERITNAIEATFRQDGYVDTYDLRDFETNQLENKPIDSVSRPRVLVEVRVSLIGAELQATIVARIPASGKVVWTASMGSDRESDFLISSDMMTEFVMGAVDSIEAFIMRQPGPSARPTLYAAVHQLFGLSREGISDAKSMLGHFVVDEYSANAEAWLAFAAGLTLGEAHDSSSDILELAGQHIDHAVEMEPSNAVVLAIAGHFAGFVRRDMELGRSYLAQSRKVLPNLAFGWDATAMNAIYSEDIPSAVTAAETARRLGRYSPYKFYYDASAVIASTLDGRHEHAIRIGERVLAKRPDFLPVMRHMFASYASLDHREEALSFFNRIKAVDPTFGTDDMDSRRSALPSRLSREAIESGMRRVGLLKAG